MAVVGLGVRVNMHVGDDCWQHPIKQYIVAILISKRIYLNIYLYIKNILYHGSLLCHMLYQHNIIT